MFNWPSMEKDSNTSAFSKAETWWGSSVKKLCQLSHLRRYHENLSTIFDHIAQYVHMQTGRIHTG